MFQKRILQHFDDLEGVATDIDDILIWGSDEREHDRRPEATLQKCEEMNFTLNEQKCKFNVKQVSYCGHKFTKDRVKPDDSKIKAIQDMPAPSSKKDVERLMGTVNYLAKFVPNLASITAPIRELLKKDIECYWAHEQIKAFETLKKSLPDNQVQFSSFFYPKKPVTVRCDASKNGKRRSFYYKDCHRDQATKRNIAIILRNFRLRGNVKTLKRSGRSSTTTERNNGCLTRLVKKNRMSSAKTLAKEWVQVSEKQ